MTIPNDFELEEMTQAQVDKYVTHNDDNRRLGAGVVGRLTHNFASDANYTLSTVDGSEEWRYAVIDFTDSGVLLTAGRDVVFPAKNGPAYIVTNSTAQILTMKISGQTGTAVAASETLLLYYDGTDISLVGADHALLAGSTAQAFACSNLAFPATQVASADANTLDDYEEGSWTGTFRGSTVIGDHTYTHQAGWYRKIGSLVTLQASIKLATIGTMAGNILITGLPFAPTADANEAGGGDVYNATGLTVTASESLSMFFAPTFIALTIWDSTAGPARVQETHLSGTAMIEVSGAFRV